MLALMVGQVFGLSTPRFPLYLGGALVVEAVFLAGRRSAPLVRVLACGLLIPTFGLAAEWAWTHVWGLQPWQPRTLASWGVVIGLGLVGAVLGSALGRAVSHQPGLVEHPTVALTLVALAVLLAIPYPRHGDNATATVTAIPAGNSVVTVMGDGRPAVVQDVIVQVTVTPSSAVPSPDVFRVLAWQGGSVVVRPLHSVGRGRYAIRGTIPTDGTWKSIVFLADGADVSTAPVSFPADVAYHLPPIPTPTSAPLVSRFLPDKVLLTRESHGGSALPAVLAYSGLAVVALAWLVALVGVGERMNRRRVEFSGRAVGSLA